MKVDRVISEYDKMEELSLPYRSEFGLVISELNGHCIKCDRKLTALKSRINEYTQCVELHMTGICEHCKLVVECVPYRFYSDGRTMQMDDRLGWQEVDGDSGHSSNKLYLINWILGIVAVIVLGIVVLIKVF
jgi:hypothetical protein